MAGKGRKPLPTHLKMVKGTAQKCRTNPNEPKPSDDKIKMPAFLSVEAKKHWKTVAAQLKKAGVMTNMDVDALTLYCESFARWREAMDKIQKEGAIVHTPQGYPVQSPWLQIGNKAFEQMTKLLVEFGMTPSSRTRVASTKKPDSGDGWDEL